MQLVYLAQNPSIRDAVQGAQRTAAEAVRFCKAARLRALRNAAIHPKNGF
jgi:hypothetical protein